MHIPAQLFEAIDSSLLRRYYAEKVTKSEPSSIGAYTVTLGGDTWAISPVGDNPARPWIAVRYSPSHIHRAFESADDAEAWLISTYSHYWLMGQTA